ncbi:MAG TPA: hypothetical protein PLD25_24125 [Chloroflexota bacterium]|nr:hypothetical protein [Chloroflexota bacterium]
MKKMHLFTVFLLLLAACAAGGNELVVENEAVVGDQVTAVLPTIAPTITTIGLPTTSPAAATLPPTITPAKAATAAIIKTPTEAASTGAIAPVTVDLSQITPPGTAVAATPQVIPGPGLPNPLTALVNQVSQDLARRLSIDISQVALVETVAVDWSDSSLGCPQPGMGYLTVITPGYVITLTAQGEEYTYHTDQGRYFVLCGADGRPVPE